MCVAVRHVRMCVIWNCDCSAPACGGPLATFFTRHVTPCRRGHRPPCRLPLYNVVSDVVTAMGTTGLTVWACVHVSPPCMLRSCRTGVVTDLVSRVTHFLYSCLSFLSTPEALRGLSAWRPRGPCACLGLGSTDFIRGMAYIPHSDSTSDAGCADCLHLTTTRGHFVCCIDQGDATRGP